MRKSILWAGLIFGGVLLTAASAAAGAASVALNFAGLAPVRVGMRVVDAETALGTSLITGEEVGMAGCFVASRADGQAGGVDYMIENGIITRITVTDGSIRTDKGIGVGSSVMEVQKTYGSQLRISPHPDAPEDWLYMEVYGPQRSRALLFEAEKGVVRNFRAGLTKSVEYVEDCL